MLPKPHKKGTKDFKELTFSEQAKAINAEIVNLQKAIKHHIRYSSTPQKTREKCLNQIRRLLGRLER